TGRLLGEYNLGVATLRALVHAGDKTSGDARSWCVVIKAQLVDTKSEPEDSPSEVEELKLLESKVPLMGEEFEAVESSASMIEVMALSNSAFSEGDELGDEDIKEDEGDECLDASSKEQIGYPCIGIPQLLPEEDRVYTDIPVYPPFPSPVASLVATPIATILVGEDQFIEVGAQLELHGSILQDHTQRLDALPPTLVADIDRDVREMYTRSGVVRDEIFSQTYKFRSLEREQERTAMTFGALWRPVLALEA
ncbi:hypothetical protein Tco_1181009, partial [Tanacetum coccineum]